MIRHGNQSAPVFAFQGYHCRRVPPATYQPTLETILLTFPEDPRQNDQKIPEAQKAPPLIDLFGSEFSGLGMIP